MADDHSKTRAAKVVEITTVESENIDAVRELIMQDRHVIYREIKAFLGISPTSIHSTLHGRKNDLFSLDPAQFDNR